MEKDFEQLKKAILDLGQVDMTRFLKACKIVDQLDEYEVLSSEWIGEYAKAVTYDGIPDETEVVYVDDLQQNLLVPKWGEITEELYPKVHEHVKESVSEMGEPKYYVLDRSDRVLLVRSDGDEAIKLADHKQLSELSEVEKESHALTEQEIRSYDEKFLMFINPVDKF